MNRKITLVALTSILALLVAPMSSEASRKGDKKRDPIVKGFITVLSSEAVVVQGKTIRLRATTKYEGYNDEVLELDAFSIGDCVKVKLARGQAVLTAREMELEDGCRRGGSSDDDSSARPTPKPTKTPKPAKTPKPQRTPDSDDDSDDDDDKVGSGKGRGKGGAGRPQGNGRGRGDQSSNDDDKDHDKGDDRGSDRDDDGDDDKNDDRDDD